MTSPTPEGTLSAADEVGPLNCWYCDDSPTYEHTSSGVALECASCGTRGPIVEGMDNALKWWNVMNERAREQPAVGDENCTGCPSCWPLPNLPPKERQPDPEARYVGYDNRCRAMCDRMDCNAWCSLIGKHEGNHGCNGPKCWMREPGSERHAFVGCEATSRPCILGDSAACHRDNLGAVDYPPAPEDAEALLRECREELRLLLIHHAEVSSTGCKPYLRAEALLAHLARRSQEGTDASR